MTDSPYVVASMGIMTRMGTPVLNKLAEGVEFVRCQHSVGRPLPLKGADSKSLNRVLFVISIRFCNILYIFLPFICSLLFTTSSSGELVALQPRKGADIPPARHQADPLLRQWLWRELSPWEKVLCPAHRLPHRQR